MRRYLLLFALCCAVSGAIVGFIAGRASAEPFYGSWGKAERNQWNTAVYQLMFSPASWNAQYLAEREPRHCKRDHGGHRCHMGLAYRLNGHEAEGLHRCKLDLVVSSRGWRFPAKAWRCPEELRP